MSTPKYSWWKYAMNVVEDWNRLLEDMPVLSCDYQEQKALRQAIANTQQLPQGQIRYSFVALIYCDEKKRTLKEAAALVGISEKSAKEWHGDFLRLIGVGLGFDTNKPSKKPGRKPKTKTD